jgi:formylglycine-generating enzyme required for sulfatase activity
MKASLLASLAMALVAMAQTATAPPPQAAPKVDSKEMAAVQRIRTQIEERAAKAPAGKASAYKVTIPNTTITFDMAPAPAGEFTMGSSAPNAKPDEQPPHKVKMQAFWMQAHEVTWDAYLLFMFADQAKETGHPDATVDALSRPTAPFVEMSFGRGTTGFPAISMTQHAASKFAEWLSAKTGEYYRLPTEAEWEYACKAGTETGMPSGSLDDHAWFAGNATLPQFPKGTYHKVGTKKPNSWGLYDMIGNVMEWTLDQYAPYSAGPAEDPWVKATAPYPHAVRGGSWNDPEARVGCTVRVPSDALWKKQDPQLPKSIWYMTDAPWLGFRLVRPAALPPVEDMYRAWNSGVELDPY